MAADAASSLTTCRDDLACSYQTCRKVVTFTRRFLVTDLATLTGSSVEDLQIPIFLKVTVTSFPRRFLVTDLATLTGSGVEDFQIPFF